MMKKYCASLGLVTAALLLLARPALAADFTVSGNSTTAQTLGSGSGQTGTVTSTGNLTVSGSTVAVTISGNNATLTNNGTISQTGNGRVIRDNTGVTNLTVTNNAGALMQAADADVIQMNKSPASVTLNNYGTMTSLNASAGGSQAVDFNAIQSGTNIVNNFAGGIMQASEADAVRPGVNGVVNNDGLIKSTTTTGSSSDGVDAQTNSGITINNAGSGTGTGTIEGGRHGITGGNTTGTGAYTMSITNNAGGTIKGDNGSGINIDGINGNELVTIVNHGTITGNGHDLGDGTAHDGDGVDVDGVVNLTNTGTIASLNSFGAGGIEFSEGVTVGGGTITNSGTIEGSVAGGNLTAVGRGITIAGVDKDANGLPITVQAPYAATTITNSGLIKGDSDSAIVFSSPLASGFSHTINNLAGGVIQTGSSTAAAILTAADNVTINNSGTIDGTSSGKAIGGGSGNLSVNILGGAATVNGDIAGGTGSNTLNFDLGSALNAFTHSGTISNFNTVSVASGNVTLNGNNTYAGVTNVGGGSLGASLAVNGTHTGGGTYDIKSNGTLTGTGLLSLASAGTLLHVESGGILHPGTGRLTIDQGSLQVDGTLHFDLNGSAAGVAGGYDQLLFGAGNTGTLSLGSLSALQVSLGFTPVIGQQFELIDVANASTSILGTFQGLSEGGILTAGGTEFQVSYVGGTGNDLVLTAVPEPAPTVIISGAFALGFAALRRLSKTTRATPSSDRATPQPRSA